MGERERASRPASGAYFVAVCAAAIGAGALTIYLASRELAVTAIVLGLYALHVESLRRAVRAALSRASRAQTPAPAEAHLTVVSSARRGSLSRPPAGAARRSGSGRGAPDPADVPPAARRAAQSRAWWRAATEGSTRWR